MMGRTASPTGLFESWIQDSDFDSTDSAEAPEASAAEARAAEASAAEASAAEEDEARWGEERRWHENAETQAVSSQQHEQEEHAAQEAETQVPEDDEADEVEEASQEVLPPGFYPFDSRHPPACEWDRAGRSIPLLLWVPPTGQNSCHAIGHDGKLIVGGARLYHVRALTHPPPPRAPLSPPPRHSHPPRSRALVSGQTARQRRPSRPRLPTARPPLTSPPRTQGCGCGCLVAALSRGASSACAAAI